MANSKQPSRGKQPTRRTVQQRLVRQLRQLVLSHAPGTRLPGVHVLARELETSSVTLRLAIQQLAEEGMVECKPQSGTYVAKRQSRKPVAVLAVHDLLHPQASRFQLFLMGDLRRRLQQMGVPWKLYIGECRPWEAPADNQYQPSHAPPQMFLDDLQSGLLGSIISLSGGKLDTWLHLAQQQQVPVVSAHPAIPAWVRPSYLDAIQSAVHRLAQRGCRRLAIMDWKDTDPNKTTRPAARQIFADALRANDLSVEMDWIRGEFHPTRRHAGADAFREMWAARREKFDGLIIADDVLARSALPAIASMPASVREKLSLVCHANEDDVLTAPYPISWMRVERQPMVDGLLQLLRDVERTPDDVRPVSTPVAWIESSTSSDADANLWITSHGVRTRISTDQAIEGPGGAYSEAESLQES